MSRWLTRAQAATRVGRSERTIRNWVHAGVLAPRLGRFLEDDVVKADKTMRARVGRPPKIKYTNQEIRSTEGD